MADYLAQHGWRDSALTDAEKSMCQYAETLTRTPGKVTIADVEKLRTAGWSDREIHDAAQVISYFNYINRIADGLGVDLEPEFPKLCADD